MTKSKYTHEELKKIALSDPKTKQVYDELEDEFSLFKDRIFRTRKYLLFQ